MAFYIMYYLMITTVFQFLYYKDLHFNFKTTNSGTRGVEQYFENKFNS